MPEASVEIDSLLQQVVQNADAAGKVIILVLSGMCDDNLDGIEMAVNQRKQMVHGLPKGVVGVDSNLSPLSVGDKIFFNNQCRPQYLRGTFGTVVGKYGKKVRVEVADDRNAQRYRNEAVLVPSEVITKA